MKKRYSLPILLILVCLIAPFCSAQSQADTNLNVYYGTTDVVISSPFLDLNLFILLFLLGLGFAVLSNVCRKDQGSVLWGIFAIIFENPMAYFALQLKTFSAPYLFNGTAELHVNIVNVVEHPEWLCVLLVIIGVLLWVNLYYVMTKEKSIEKTNKAEFLGDGNI